MIRPAYENPNSKDELQHAPANQIPIKGQVTIPRELRDRLGLQAVQVKQ